MNHWSTDTIAAIATAPGEAGLCIVRMSGPASFHIADEVFSGSVHPSRCKSHTVHYGHIRDPLSNDLVDEVLLTILRRPRTFTCEDVIEISGHGGYRSGTRILEALIRNGARLAEPGEFTKRAFLNGRLDLLQAEAVAEIIKGRTDAAQRAGLRQLHGAFSDTIRTLRDGYLDLLTLIEVGMDFTEEHIEEIGYPHFLSLASALHDKLTDIITHAQKWRNLRDGVRIVLIGRPNVGKSSLLNRFVDQERAIVDASPGTTRDTIVESIDFNGVPVSFIDTAGIRNTDASIESKGITRTLQEIESSDLYLWILDGSQLMQPEDTQVFEYLESEKSIGVINKCDVPQQLHHEELRGYNLQSWSSISALTGAGLDELKDVIFSRLIGHQDINASQALINSRQLETLNAAQEYSAQVLLSLKNRIDQELISIDIKSIIHHLDQILGIEIGDDLLDRIFSTFCIGK